MSSSTNIKEVGLSLVYLLLVLIILGLLDAGLMWFMNNVMFKALNWFNDLHWFFKIIILLIGGLSLFVWVLNFITRGSTLLGGIIFNYIPINPFTKLIGLILSILNTVYCIYLIWTAPEHYSFWVVIELIFISVFVWSLTNVIRPAKEQLEVYEREDRYRQNRY